MITRQNAPAQTVRETWQSIHAKSAHTKSAMAISLAAVTAAAAIMITTSKAHADKPKHTAAPPVSEPIRPAVSELETGRDLVVQRCSNCHAIEEGADTFAPPLVGLFGRRSGTYEGFTYTPVMKNLNVEWSPSTLSDWLAATTFDTPDIRMRHVGLPDPILRRAVIAFIKTLPGNHEKEAPKP